MLLLALVPYIVIVIGVGLGFAGLRPAILTWAICAVGTLCGLAIAIFIFSAEQPNAWIFSGIAAFPFILAVAMAVKDLSYPRINDVTTDIENPPEFEVALDAAPNEGRKMTFPKRFGPIVRKAYPNVRPVNLNGPPDKVFQSVAELAENQSGWIITHCDSDKRVIEAEATTPLLRFIDDVVIRVTGQDGKCRVDMRSKSREGLVDAGKNAKRIQAFLEKLSAP